MNTKHYEAQAPHTKEDCKVNERPHNHPDTDCGHYVNEGPATKQTGDLNIYDEDNGKKSIVAGGPKHNLDQDVTNGPGVK